MIRISKRMGAKGKSPHDILMEALTRKGFNFDLNQEEIQILTEAIESLPLDDEDAKIIIPPEKTTPMLKFLLECRYKESTSRTDIDLADDSFAYLIDHVPAWAARMDYFFGKSN